MEFSVGILAKGLLGIGAIGTVYTGYLYGDQIVGYFYKKKEEEKIESKLILNKSLADSKRNDLIKDVLGVDDNSDCLFKNDKEITKECTLDNTVLKKVKFINYEDKDATVTTADKSLNVKIEGIEFNDKGPNYPVFLKFKFKANDDNSNVEIGNDGYKIVIDKKGHDFRVKLGTKKLQSAWNLDNLGEKVGLVCDNEKKECTVGDGGINLWKEDGDYITGAKAKGDEKNKKIGVEIGSKDHREGFKFTVKNDITLTEGTSKKASGGISKLTKDTKTYEIGIKDKDNTKT